MLFFDKPRLIIFLRRNALEIYKGNVKTAEVNYPPNTIRFLEIVDLNIFEKFILGILPQKHEGQKIILMLDSDMAFYKVFPRTTAAEEEVEIKNFIGKIPFTTEQLTIKKIMSDKEFAIVAITRNLYLPIANMLKKAGFMVEAVVPISMFGKIDSESPLNQKGIWQKINDNKTIAKGDFLRG